METLIKIFVFLAVGGTIATLYACLVVASDADDKEEERIRKEQKKDE